MSNIEASLYKEFQIEAAIPDFSHWLQNQILGMQYNQQWQAVAGNQPDLIVSGHNLHISSSTDRVWFEIELAWAREKGRARNEKGKIAIFAKRKMECLAIRIDFSTKDLDTFVSNMVIAILNKYPQRAARGARKARNETPEGGRLAQNQVTGAAEPPVLPTKKPRLEDLSDDEKLCLAWAYHDTIAVENYETFLQRTGHDGNIWGKKFISKEQFKIMLRKAGLKGILKKEGRRWKPAPEYMPFMDEISAAYL